MRKPPHRRLLAIAPCVRGFGFVVLEGPGRLVDWGVAGPSRKRTEILLRRVENLLDRYQPHLLVLEDAAAVGSRRSSGVRGLLDAIADLARERRVRIRFVSRREIRRAFAKSEAVTKPQIAAAIAGQFPELARHLPPRRKAWMGEDARMGIFDAAGLALTAARSTPSGQS